MRFTCKTSNLREAISKVEKIVSKQITLPILANVYLGTENGRLVISATNLEIAIKTYIGGKIENDGEITIPPRILGGFLSNVKEEVISGEVGDMNLEVTSSSHRLKVKGLDAKDFPIIPEMPETIFFTVDSMLLAKNISSVLVSVGHNDTRQELNGVFMKLEKDSVILAATDSFRLSEVILKLDEKSVTEEYLKFIERNPSVIIPSLTLMELVRVLDKEALSFSIDQSQLFIKNSNFKIISRLVNGNYPEYRQVIPQKYEVSIRVDRNELVDAVKIASLVASNQNGEVKMACSEDKKFLLVSAQSMDTGDNLSKIPARIEGPAFEVIFNCRYLAEGLSIPSSSDGDILIKLNQQKSPVLIRGLEKDGKEDENFSYIIMPIVKG